MHSLTTFVLTAYVPLYGPPAGLVSALLWVPVATPVWLLNVQLPISVTLSVSANAAVLSQSVASAAAASAARLRCVVVVCNIPPTRCASAQLPPRNRRTSQFSKLG